MGRESGGEELRGIIGWSLPWCSPIINQWFKLPNAAITSEVGHSHSPESVWSKQVLLRLVVRSV